jgi:AraC family transcriptional regulator
MANSAAMKYQKTGQFYGETNETLNLEGLTLTDTVYTHPKVDWHYHENAYFTLILQGNMIEGNKKEVYHCPAGTLLYHHWQEPHYNIKPEGFTRGFHLELTQDWFSHFDIDRYHLQGSINIADPDIKLLLYRVFKETKLKEVSCMLSIQQLLLQALTFDQPSCCPGKPPLWVRRLKEILYAVPDKQLSLHELSGMLDIHPVHLSRGFPKYFGCNLGEYVRKIKVERSLHLLAEKLQSLSEIAFACGFADQSHFFRCFKEICGIGPNAYRKLLTGRPGNVNPVLF